MTKPGQVYISTKTEKSNFGEFLELSKKGEGMVFYGAGGDLNDWVKGIAGALKEEGISKSGDPRRIWKSYHLAITTGGRRDLLMLFTSEPDIDMGRLCIWRLKYGGCSWLSDYVVNYVGQHDYAPPLSKPKCKLTGTHGNVFALAGKVSAVLKKAGLHTQVGEFMNRLPRCGSYDEALNLMGEYVEVE